MQNNVTDLLQKLQRSLDNSYNVIDMPTVIEIISALEKTSVTKELLETTRLGKYINELRRRTSNESLKKRAKELVKKWRVLLLPDANGQIKAESSSKKRSACTPPDLSTKRCILNGQSRELDFSDNSNCSVKDLKKTDVIFINSDSNSSVPDQNTDLNSSSHSNDNLDLSDGSNLIPKKRGRKKGSKNHKNLVIAAEESFSNKMAVGRNSKVKTTQELLADLQSRATSAPKSSTQQDFELRTAQLTESLSRIDQKLNPQKQINKNVTPIRNNPNSVNNVVSKTVPHRTVNEVQSWLSRTNSPEIVTIQSDDEIVDVVSTDPPMIPITTSTSGSIQESPPEPLTLESLLSQLPPLDRSCLDEPDEIPPCSCPLPAVPQNDRITVQIVDEGKSLFAPASPLTFDPADNSTEKDELEVKKSDEVDLVRTSDDESENCPARNHLHEKYSAKIATEQLQSEFLPSVNGNWGVRTEPVDSESSDADIVPRLGAERLPRATENFQKYSISIAAQDDTVGASPGAQGCDRTEFREWHETLDVRSYNGDVLRILPYVIID